MNEEEFPEYQQGDEVKEYHLVQAIAYATVIGLIDVDEEAAGVERAHMLSFICSEGNEHNFVLSQEAWETLAREASSAEPV